MTATYSDERISCHAQEMTMGADEHSRKVLTVANLIGNAPCEELSVRRGRNEPESRSSS